MSGGGPAADASGNIYLSTGNGTFGNAGNGDPNYGDSLLKLSSGLNVIDSFTPWNQADLETADIDLAQVDIAPSGSARTTPTLNGSWSENRRIYLVDRDSLGGYQECGPTCDNVVQVLPIDTVNPIFDTPAYFNGRVYYHACCGDVLKAFALAGGALSVEPVLQAVKPFAYPEPFPVSLQTDRATGLSGLWSALLCELFYTPIVRRI